MGVKVTAAQAAQLVGRSEKWIRAAIRRGELPAEEDTVQGGRRARPGQGVGPSRWAIDVDDLLKLSGVRVNQVLLAELKAQADGSSQGMLARIAELERQVRDLQRQVRDLRARSYGVNGGAREASGSDALSVHGLADDDTTGGVGRVTYPQGANPSDSALSAPGAISPFSGRHEGDLRDLSPDSRDVASRYPSPMGYRGPRTVALADRGAGGPLRFKTKSDAARWLGRHGVNELTPKSWRGWPPLEMTPAAVLAFAQEVQAAAQTRGDWRVTWRLHRCTDPECVCQETLAE